MSDSVEIITRIPPAYHYRRFNPGLRKIGFVLDRLCPWYKSCAIPTSRTDLDEAKVLILESHLIGDAVMTLALVNSLKIQAPTARVVLCAQPWIRELLPDDMVSGFIPLRLPWVGSGKFKANVWFSFLKALVTLKREKFQIAIETRGDWRNSLVFWVIAIPIRIGSPMTGGKVFLTHPTRLIMNRDPLWATRSAALELIGLDSKLILPKPPTKPATLDSNSPYVVVHPGASQGHRQINDAQIDLIVERLNSPHARIIVAAGRGEVNLQSRVQEKLIQLGFRAERWSGNLRTFLGLCQGADQVFTMDSGPAHLAAWVGAKLTIFCNHDACQVVRPIDN